MNFPFSNTSSSNNNDDSSANRNLILFNLQCKSNILIIINSLFYSTEFVANAKFHRQFIIDCSQLSFNFWHLSSWVIYLWVSEWVSVFDLLNGLSWRTELCEVISQIRLWLNIILTFCKAPFGYLWLHLSSVFIHSFLTVF